MSKFDRTQQLNVDDLVKTIPVICSWCNKIYHIKHWQAEKGERTGVSQGICPECEKKRNELDNLPEEETTHSGYSSGLSSDNEAPFRGTRVIDIDAVAKTIPVVCSWCNKIYHIKQWQVDKGKRTGASHGMCPECEKKQLEELDKLNADSDN